MSEATLANRRYQCRHIFTDGRRCGSPSLRGENFCYYHHATRRPRPAAELHDPYNYPPNQCPVALTLPEDRSAIQHSIGQIMKSLAENALDPRRAGLLLYALQIASQNLKNAPQLRADEVVQDVTLDPIEGPLAPHNEVPGDALYREFLESYGEEDDEDFEDDGDDQDDEDFEDEDEDLGDEEEPEDEASDPEEIHEDIPEDSSPNSENGEPQGEPELAAAGSKDTAVNLQGGAAPAAPATGSPAASRRKRKRTPSKSASVTKKGSKAVGKTKKRGFGPTASAVRTYLRSALLEAKVRPWAMARA